MPQNKGKLYSEEHHGRDSVQAMAAQLPIRLYDDRVLSAVKSFHSEIMAEVKQIKAQMSWVQNQQDEILNRINCSVDGSFQVSDDNDTFKLPITNNEMHEDLLKQIQETNTRKALVSHRKNDSLIFVL